MSHHRTKPPNQQRTYGLLVGQIKAGEMDPPGSDSPHYEIWVHAANKDYRIAVNVQSVDGSNVLALYIPNFTAPTKLNLPTRAATPGFTPLKTGAAGQGLDYLRDNLFPINQMQPIPDEGGSGVTLKNLLDGNIKRAVADNQSVVLALGQFFQDPGADETFHFSPELGVHDIHMMQGNSGSFADDNTVNGDGALFIRFAGGETMALFIRFDTQVITTSDSTGASTPGI